MRAIYWAALAAALAAPAAAKDKPVETFRLNLAEMTRSYTYFNRPGADAAQHEAEIIDCSLLAGRVQSVDDQINNGAGMGLAGAMFGSYLGNVYNRAAFAAALENCMVVRGWRVIRVPDETALALIAQGGEAVRAKIAPSIGAETPEGEVVRVWGNDAARASTNRYEIRPGRTDNGSLSLLAVPDLEVKVAAKQTAFEAPPRGVKLDKKWPKRPLKPEQLAAAPPGAAILIVHVKGSRMGNGGAVNFRREGPDLATPASVVDNAPDLFAAVPGLSAGGEGKTVAVAVPAGRWRIASMGLMPAVNFCLGAPGFEIKAGEVVYAGAFHVHSETLGPDLSLDLPKAWLAGQPQAAQLRAAEYTNGWRGACADNNIYALEIPGAPFVEGYGWGSAYARGPAAAPTAAEEPAQAATLQ